MRRDWTGIGVPKNTPAEIVDKLATEINAALGEPKMKARLADLGSLLMPMSRADFGKLIADETERWGKGGEVRGHQAGMIREIFRNGGSEPSTRPNFA